MINDLKAISTNIVSLSTEVCIVGGGTAGIFLAQELDRFGIETILLESGSETISRPPEINEQCFQVGIPYRGAEQGRAFGLGGTSTLWGGQMIALSPSDFEKRPNLSLDAWPLNHSDLGYYFEQVRERLEIKKISDEVSFKQKYFPDLFRFGEEFNLRVADWIPFKNRNFAQRFDNELESSTKIQVWLNSVVTTFAIDDESDQKRIDFIEAKSTNSKTLRIKSKYFVICAGALESTRLVLSLDESSQGLITSLKSPVGRYFADHLSLTGGKIKCRNWNQYNAQIAPVFDGKLMRSPRLELSSTSQQEHNITSAFVHFTFITSGNSGFDLIRNLFRKQQGEQIKYNLASIPLSQIIQDSFLIALWRGMYQRLWVPRESDLFLQVDIEQLPNWNSRIFLSDEVDDFGRKKLVIDWQITPDDIRTFTTTANLAKKAWDSSMLNDFADLDLTLNPDMNNLESVYDVYHPTGSLRMGENPATSVVDSNLKLWTLDNCFISSTAVFPTAGSANPGFTHLALTMRLAKYLAQKAR